MDFPGAAVTGSGCVTAAPPEGMRELICLWC